MQIIEYAEALASLGAKQKNLLLGNGFSVGCDPIFRYECLYDRAVQQGLSERAQAVFERIGTNNFEGVLRLLLDADWVAQEYQLLEPTQGSPIVADIDVIKKALVDAVAASHLAHTGLVSASKKNAALRFLSPYHNVFTTNYDLLLYWVVMHQPGAPSFLDGFDSDPDEPEAPYVTFQHRLGGHRGIYFLHGGLHLYDAHGELRKHTWCRTGVPLTDSIRAGLDQGLYPLFVAEGRPEKKLEQIQRSWYLGHCLSKLSRLESPLVVFGHALGESDWHLLSAIARNRKLRRLAVGLYGDPRSSSNRQICDSVAYAQDRRVEELNAHRTSKVEGELDVLYFSSESANVWGQ